MQLGKKIKEAEDCLSRNRNTVPPGKGEERAPPHTALARPHLGQCLNVLVFMFTTFSEGCEPHSPVQISEASMQSSSVFGHVQNSVALMGKPKGNYRYTFVMRFKVQGDHLC